MSAAGEDASLTQSLTHEQPEQVLRPARELSALCEIPISQFLERVKVKESTEPAAINLSEAGLFVHGAADISANELRHLHDIATREGAGAAAIRCGGVQPAGPARFIRNSRSG
jgi:hypothetical protein